MNNSMKTNRTEYWDHKLDSIIDEKLLNDVIKFHQSASLIRRNNSLYPYNQEMFDWLTNTEFTDILPNYYLKEIEFHIEKRSFQNSQKIFDKDASFSKDLLGRIIYQSFGRSNHSPSKRYPSAGGLYPVIPLIYILNNYVIEGQSDTRGCYIFDTSKLTLKKIKEWDDQEFEDFLAVLNAGESNIYSNLVIGYAIDLKRTIAKYKQRGYRHALIEVGLMAQTLRECLINENENLGDFCWSGFDDNAVTYLSGLNPRLSPITLMQWVGFIGEK